ncbi:hypothetical protein BKA70DRAFT_1306364 [Coprinopsis sp. MPI-PUGE-AT-0042]|nr:hypothetical protein BKA70DRAFT_1306364 [Coprinopsis sp. MPI-PUGE-AT-0042]
MATPDPVWRVRTRPCPFYQRGACIFAANCNFLHTGPAGRRKDSGYDSDSSTRSLKSPEPMGHPPTPLKKPVLVVDSPRSVSTPLREPHMARLLSALSPVIGDEDDGEEEEADEPYLDSATLVEPDSAAWSAGLPTLTHGEDSAFFARVTETMAEMMEATESDDDDEDDPENTMLENHDDNDPYDFSDAFFSKSQNDSGSRSRSSSGSSHHASPSILRSRNYAPPSPSDDTLRLPANNNHIPEPTETPSIHTTHSSPEPEQILEMPAIPDNHDDLLSPVDLSHLQLHNFSGLSPDLWQSSNPFGDTNYNNNNAESSNNTTMPAFASFMPHPSPPKSPGLMMSTTSAVGILRSPFGSPLRPSLLSPRIGAFFRPSPSSSPQANVSQPVHSLEDDLDSPSQHQWNAIASPSQLPYAASESGEVEEGRGSPSPSSSSSESESDSGSESPEEEDEESISDEEHEDVKRDQSGRRRCIGRGRRAGVCFTERTCSGGGCCPGRRSRTGGILPRTGCCAHLGCSTDSRGCAKSGCSTNSRGCSNPEYSTESRCRTNPGCSSKTGLSCFGGF